MKGIIGIHGVPRSGTSWLAQIFNSSPYVNMKFQPLFSYAFKDYITTFSSSQDIEEYFNLLYKSDDYFVNMKDKEIHKNYPIFEKIKTPPYLCFKHVRYHYLIEHFLRNNLQIKFVLIVRNPLAVLSSWKNAPREFKSEWNFNEEWICGDKKNLNRPEEYFGFKKWKESTLLFLELQKKYPDRVKIVNYKELLENTLKVSNNLFEFCNILLTEEVQKFIEASKTSEIDNDSNSVYRIKFLDDKWKTDLPMDIIDNVYEDLNGSILERYIYD